MCLPYLKFSDPLPKTHLFFDLALSQNPRFAVYVSVQINGIAVRSFDTNIFSS